MSRSPKKKTFESYDGSFYWLANSIASVLAENKLEGTSQKEQVEELIEAEKAFKEEILKYKFSTQVYKKFIQKIRYLDRNILYSKIYFREGSDVFSNKITPYLKKEDAEGLKQFNINFNLIQFIRLSWRGPLGQKAEKLYKRVEKARRILMENNLPLAINAAKLFYRKVPKSNVTLLDMISVSAQGLASAIDKYVGDKNGNYSEVFRSVILGRATGNLIKLYSETPMHFYPSDRKIMYKANSIRGRQGIHDIVELAAAVNDSFAADSKEGLNVPKEKVTPSELQSLLSAATLISVESTVDEDGFGAYEYTPDELPNAESSLINTETNQRISKTISEMPLLHRKVLRLKGIDF
jgi:DNA-directed RNA polymerase specialized sigma subunit